MRQTNRSRGRVGRAGSFRSSFRTSQRLASLLALIAMIFYSVRPAWAADNGWLATTDFNWDTLLNWSSGAAPTATDDVVFPSPIPNPNSLPNPNVISLSNSEFAN